MISELGNLQIHPNLANKLQEEGKIEEAIDYYQIVANEIEDKNLLVWQKLAHLYEQKKDFKNADSYYQKIIDLKPNDARHYIKLAKVLQQQGRMAESISIYHKAISLNPNPDQCFGVYKNLGRLFLKEGQLDESIDSYSKAIQLQPENPVIYCLLAKSQAKKGDIEGAIASYQNAWSLDSEKSLVHLNSIANALIQNQERYLHIWRTLNPKHVEGFDPTRYCYPTNNSWGGAKEYFDQTSNYRVKGLWELDREDRLFLKANNICLDHLKSINRDSLDKQETHLQHFNQNLQFDYQQLQFSSNDELHRISKLTAFQKPMITGYTYITCPFSGQVIRTNQSFLINRVICAYRFVSNRIFYLFASNFLFEKVLIYFPHLELVIKMRGNTFMEPDLMINRLKAFFVANWQHVMSYLVSESRKEVAALVGIDRNLGHHMWNELAGIHELCENGSLDKIDKFLLPPYDVFGKIEEIFPEIPAHKIIRSSDANGDQLCNIALANNYFVMRPRGIFIKEELSSRIYQLSLQNCPSATLSQIEEAKQHFPLMWIDLRLNKRFWVSQVSGVSKIISKLLQEYPNLGIVFDGFSLLAKDMDKGEEDLLRKQAVIAKERAVVEEIVGLITDHQPTVYNTIGCTIYESVAWAHAIDLYIAHWGAGLTKTTFVANKPGVVHTNYTGLNRAIEKRFYCFERENGIVPSFVPKDSVVEINGSNPKAVSYSYDCDWEAVYDEVVKLIPQLKVR